MTSRQLPIRPTARTRAVMIIALVAGVTLAFTSCKPHADHWVVIGTPALQSDCQLQQEIPNAPECLKVEKGETVGFANFSEGTVTVNVDPADTFLGVSGSFSLEHGDWKVLTVNRQGIEPLITLQATTPPLGGPRMIIDP